MTENVLAPSSMSAAIIPALVRDAGPAAQYAWDEYFLGMIRNRHTQAAYRRAVHRFLKWLEPQQVSLVNVTAGMIGTYLNSLSHLAAPSRKVELAALRGWFDVLTLRHVVVLNPTHSVKGDRLQTVEGSTPEISPVQARALLDSIDRSTLVGQRDAAIIACLAFTAARVGAVAALTRGSLQSDGTHWRLRFLEKYSKRREIPVSSALEKDLLAYVQAAQLQEAPAGSPLFRSADGKSGRLTAGRLTGGDIGRMVKRRLAAAGLPTNLSPHSFRVAVATDLLKQSISLEDVQYLLGHSDPRTTRLYDRRHREVTRNIVERISI
jgi:integrase/recombinase XerD